ncbi:MAG: hypothetical protein CFH03_02152 [Alphaproteobacteria bacterium MarineAlpha3_Bin2]|jgi:TRAP-type mannitol/chloroaromatic compound transport system permease large subunit|nr:MAG: hypothetical protein CFH03_02152 [Alphaproteobacteria bacterium MarineAlpha3_Bin2]
MFISNMTLPQYDCMVSPTLIVTVVGAEIGLLTPPLGLSCFAIKTTLDDPTITLTDIFSGAFPFAVVMLLVLIVVIAYPVLSLALI